MLAAPVKNTDDSAVPVVTTDALLSIRLRVIDGGDPVAERLRPAPRQLRAASQETASARTRSAGGLSLEEIARLSACCVVSYCWDLFAIGALDRMPLRRMTFRMEPAAGGGGGSAGGGGPSPWVTLRHVESGGELVMLPKGASQGGFMLLARQGQAPASAASRLFCAEVPQQGQGQG